MSARFTWEEPARARQADIYLTDGVARVDFAKARCVCVASPLLGCHDDGNDDHRHGGHGDGRVFLKVP